MSKPSKHHKLKCSVQVRAMMFGEEDQKVKDMLTIMDMTDEFLHIPDKSPENHSFMLTNIVIARQRNVTISGWPKEEKE
jgi:hypothetical protein